MIKRILKWLGDGEPMPAAYVFTQTELEVGESSNLVIRTLGAGLGVSDLQRVADRVREAGCEPFVAIRFDLSRVEQLVGPWGAHFAVLIRLAEDVGRKVRLIGLHGQPASVAWLFRHSPAVRDLICGTDAHIERPAKRTTLLNAA